jgi:hypothetical protein
MNEWTSSNPPERPLRSLLMLAHHEKAVVVSDPTSEPRY